MNLWDIYKPQEVITPQQCGGVMTIFSAFMIPENVQKELESAGADRVSVGWPVPQAIFRDIFQGWKLCVQDSGRTAARGCRELSGGQ